MICAYCKCRVFPEDRKCPSCGSRVFVEEEIRKAPQEEEKSQETAHAAQPEREVHYQTIYRTIYVKPETSAKSRWVALVLCLFFGWVGVHRFYVGKNATGVLYLLTGGLLGMGLAVDFLMILFGYFRDRDGLRLSN